MSLSVMDIIFILLIALLVIRCFLKGFVSEVMTMAAIVLGIFASLFFYKNGGEFLREKFWPEIDIIPEILAFIALFLIVFIVIKLLEGLLKGIIHGIRLNSLDRFLGIIFGLAEGIVLVCLILFIIKIQPLFDSSALLADSFFARVFLPLITGPEFPAKLPAGSIINV